MTVAALALAQGGAIGSYGHGAATDAHGRHATFDYNVSRSMVHGHPVNAGRLRFVELGHDGVVIEMGRPTALGADHNVCEFAGPGVLRHLDAHGHTVTVHGDVAVRVSDNHTPHHTDHDADAIRVRFHSMSGDYAFEGMVTDGDLVVVSAH